MTERLCNTQGTPLSLSMSTALYIGKSNCGHRQSRCLSVSCPRIPQIIHSHENINQNCMLISFLLLWFESIIPDIVLNSFAFFICFYVCYYVSLWLVHRSRWFCWPKKFKNPEKCHHLVHFWPDNGNFVLIFC